MLLLRRQLEHKQVADLAMLDSKEAWTLLYKMLKAGYVHMQVCCCHPQVFGHVYFGKSESMLCA